MKTFDTRPRPTGQRMTISEYATSDGSRRCYSLLMREWDVKGEMVDEEVKVNLSAHQLVRQIRIELDIEVE